jgi:hypothetical protein
LQAFPQAKCTEEEVISKKILKLSLGLENIIFCSIKMRRSGIKSKSNHVKKKKIKESVGLFVYKIAAS